MVARRYGPLVAIEVVGAHEPWISNLDSRADRYNNRLGAFFGALSVKDGISPLRLFVLFAELIYRNIVFDVGGGQGTGGSSSSLFGGVVK